MFLFLESFHVFPGLCPLTPGFLQYISLVLTLHSTLPVINYFLILTSHPEFYFMASLYDVLITYPPLTKISSVLL
jgi:hypothetical protein